MHDRRIIRAVEVLANELDTTPAALIVVTAPRMLARCLIRVLAGIGVMIMASYTFAGGPLEIQDHILFMIEALIGTWLVSQNVGGVVAPRAAAVDYIFEQVGDILEFGEGGKSEDLK